MKYFGIFLLIGFVGLAVFGTFGVHTGMQNHESGCIAAAIQGTDCPKETNLFEYVTFHLGTYKDFSLATIDNNVVSSLLLTLIYLLFAGLALSQIYSLKSPQLVSYNRLTNSLYNPQEQRLAHWLALHKNSPTAF
ncbi:MAG: hypothetical protein A3I33_00190 [Candidatus Colwellbacteria bacterium RIFCSPLOWO2_02_FULL_45_11]|uniref:Uncharacterized protein n=1 Tax=Candidatus Colwellbacteria bacterium RIFCSPLOWO2_02_FULL_45_11 TaxID=1797692 RepID=A0A1G1ZBG0_9BACT|nr:MAG: hypothetical protein A3I33_00190 [Candidatus Colwellbacteria bacterium RIFCSPLOWO2_02_FULL_45_11]